MTVYTSQQSDDRIEFYGDKIVISEPRDGGKGVTLTERQQREFALDILAKQFDIDYGEEREITLRPPRPKVGEFYRINGKSSMMPAFRDGPLVKVIERDEVGQGVTVETADGVPCHFGTLSLLLGPLDVVEKKVWVSA